MIVIDPLAILIGAGLAIWFLNNLVQALKEDKQIQQKNKLKDKTKP